MIQIDNVSKSYDGKTLAVKPMQLEIRSGEIFGFLGPNGAGKTTTLKMITGILQPDSGRILLEGHDIVQDPLAAKRSFGFVPDDPNIFLRLKGVEYLRFIADIYEVPASVREDRVTRLADTFGLTDVLGDTLQSYSHGMRQKMILAGALLHEPPVWILDEPMTGLDPKSSYELKQMMREHADHGHTVLFSTHVLEVAEKVCDRVAIIDKGSILFSGTIAELRQHYSENSSLEAMFLQLTEGFEQQEQQQDSRTAAAENLPEEHKHG